MTELNGFFFGTNHDQDGFLKSLGGHGDVMLTQSG
jgi:hypothetical protein